MKALEAKERRKRDLGQHLENRPAQAQLQGLGRKRVLKCTKQIMKEVLHSNNLEQRNISAVLDFTPWHDPEPRQQT